jgi:hypothetical protein
MRFEVFTASQPEEQHDLLYYYPELSWVLQRCFVLCGRLEFFTATHGRDFVPTELCDFESVVSAFDIEVLFPDQSTDMLSSLPL